MIFAVRRIDEVEVAPLAELGLGGPDVVPLLEVSYQELHPCSAPDTPDYTSDRVHDLADHPLLDELGTIELQATKEACLVVFEHRRMNVWSPTINVRPHWPGLWVLPGRKSGRWGGIGVVAVAAGVGRSTVQTNKDRVSLYV